MIKLYRFIKGYCHHKFHVMMFIIDFTFKLIWRALVHDLSKLRADERNDFIELASIDYMKNVKYGSDEYKQILKDHRGAIDIHYSRNSHHKEYHDDGVNGMDLYDLIEMIADWKAAGARTKGGNLRESFKVNRKRYKISDEIYILLNRTFLKCPQCQSWETLKFPNGHEPYCEDCGWPDEDRNGSGLLWNIFNRRNK